jgi:predicted alpha/beta superfamily hydrolase
MIRFFLVQVFLLFSAISIAQSKPFVLGIIEEINSKELSEKRVLNIYLPEGYDQNDSTQYPVIYLLDGSADEDFIHITGLVQFNSFEWVNRVPKSIVVGIATVDRRRDYTQPSKVLEEQKAFPTSGASAKFIAFIEKELQPFIQKRFRTSPSKTIIGQSLGGLLATEILLTKPALFNKYIIVSPSMWWNNAALLQGTFTNWSLTRTDSLQVYIAVGKEGLTPGVTPRVMEVDANLLFEKVKALSPRIQCYFDYLPDENHATILHQAVNNAFIRLH